MSPQSASNGNESHTSDIPEVANPLSVGRRGFVKGAVAGIGVATIGVGIRDQTAAGASVSQGSRVDGSLRAITWTGKNSAVGVVAVGADEVRLRPLSVQNGRLQSSGDDIARLSVGPGPITIGASPDAGGPVLVTRTTLESVGQFSVSFDLDSNMRQYFLDEGLGLDGYRTAGEHIFDSQQIFPEPILIDSSGIIGSSSTLRTFWKDRLAGAHYEPISVNYLDDRWILFLVGSGAYGLEASIAEEIVGVELSGVDASVTDVRSISKIDGHFSIGYKSVELDKSKIAFVSTDDTETIQVVSYDVANQVSKKSQHSIFDYPSSKRLLQHDRLSSSGRLKSWIVEVLPGTYALETMGDEIL